MLNLLKRPRPAQPNEVEIKVPADAPRPAPAMPNRSERRNAAKKAKGKVKPNYITQDQYDAAYAEHRALKDLWMAQEAQLRVNRTVNRFLIGAMLVETVLTLGMAVALAMR